jgi:HD domain
MKLEGWAADYAAELLAPMGDRWAHVQGVVRQAHRAAAILPPEEQEVLVAAAYLHDLGYAPSLAVTGLHALDGARHLRAIGHERLAGLVAYHSGARGEAELRGLTAELADFGDEASATSMALTYCDMTIGAGGEVVTLAERVADVERRYGHGKSWRSRCAVPARRWNGASSSSRGGARGRRVLVNFPGK